MIVHTRSFVRVLSQSNVWKQACLQSKIQNSVGNCQDSVISNPGNYAKPLQNNFTLQEYVLFEDGLSSHG